MNFSDYLKTCNTDETSLNETTGGLLEASKTKEFHDFFSKITKKTNMKFSYTPAYSGDKMIEISCDYDCGNIVAHLDDNANVIGLVECTPVSKTLKFTSLRNLEKAYSITMTVAIDEFEFFVIDGIKSYLKKLTK